jgi:hypothetical protein
LYVPLMSILLSIDRPTIAEGQSLTALDVFIT